MSEKNAEIGVIGGSGIYQIDSFKIIKEHKIKTPFGKPSAPILEGDFEGARCFFLPRHGVHHTLTPSEVNYRANIFGLKSLGVRYLFSISAVGSLREECPPRSFVLPDQFIDWTKGGRDRSFFDSGMVGHVSVANPVDAKLQTLLAQGCQVLGIPFKQGGAYICIEGPQFSTKAESNIYRSFGATVIGMTNVPEAYLAKEAGMAYATAAMVTDFDCWKEEHCTLDEIMKAMKDNNVAARKLLVHVISNLAKSKFQVQTENQQAIVTHTAELTAQHKKILDVLLA
jgi:5'-methylthioadenosine phosphorylase